MAERFGLDLVDDLSHEGVLEQGAGFSFGDAALAHVEECRFVHHAGGGSMCAFDVVGVDFEHGLCVHTCFWRCAEVGVGFLRSGVLGIFLYIDFACEGSDSLVVYDVFVELARGAVGHFVANQRVVVDVLRCAADGASVECDFGILAAQMYVAQVACLSVEEGDAVVLDCAVASFVDIDIAEY